MMEGASYPIEWQRSIEGVRRILEEHPHAGLLPNSSSAVGKVIVFARQVIYFRHTNPKSWDSNCGSSSTLYYHYQ